MEVKMKDKMTTDEIGALLGLSAPTIRDLQRRGVIGKEGRTFWVAETVRQYLAHLRMAQRAPAPWAKLPDLPRDFVVHKLVRIDGALYETFETLAKVVDGERVE
jgi:hypothetical protein